MKTFYSEEGKKSVTFPVKETKFCFGICRNFALPVFRDICRLVTHVLICENRSQNSFMSGLVMNI